MVVQTNAKSGQNVTHKKETFTPLFYIFFNRVEFSTPPFKNMGKHKAL